MVQKQASDIVKHFSKLTDPRDENLINHKLIDMVVIALCAVICGADGWVGVETFGKAPGRAYEMPAQDTARSQTEGVEEAQPEIDEAVRRIAGESLDQKVAEEQVNMTVAGDEAATRVQSEGGMQQGMVTAEGNAQMSRVSGAASGVEGSIMAKLYVN